jgi:hypothetical protein
LAYTDEEKKAKAMQALEKHGGKPYADAVQAHKDAQAEVEEKEKKFAIREAEITKDHEKNISDKREQLRLAQEARLAYTGSDPAARKGLEDAEGRARKEFKTANERRKLAIEAETEHIKTAVKQMQKMRQQVENLAETAGQLAVDAGDLPKQFASAGDIARETVKKSYTSLLRATNPLKVGELAEDTEKQAGKTKADPNATVKFVKQIAIPPKAPPTSTP